VFIYGVGAYKLIYEQDARLSRSFMAR